MKEEKERIEDGRERKKKRTGNCEENGNIYIYQNMEEDVNEIKRKCKTKTRTKKR